MSRLLPRGRYFRGRGRSRKFDRPLIILSYLRMLQQATGHDEHEHIVHRQRILDYVAGQKGEGAVLPLAEVDYASKDKRQRYPRNAPFNGLFERDGMEIQVCISLPEV